MCDGSPGGVQWRSSPYHPFNSTPRKEDPGKSGEMSTSVCFLWISWLNCTLVFVVTFATLISVLGFFFELPWFWFLSVWVSLFCLPHITQSKFDIKLYRYTWYATLTWNTKKWLPPELFSHFLGGFVPLQSLQKPYIHHFCSKFVDASLKMWDLLLQFISSEL